MVLQENWQQVENSCGEGVFSLGGLENKRMYVGQVYVAVVHPPLGERGGAFDSKVNCLGCEFGDCMVLQENWQQVENSCGEGVFSLGGLENKRMYVGQVYVAVVHPPLGGEGRGV